MHAAHVTMEAGREQALSVVDALLRTFGAQLFTRRLCDGGAWPFEERLIPHRSIVGRAEFQYIRHTDARMLFRSPSAFAPPARSLTPVPTIRTGGIRRAVESGYARYVLV